jgi:hypothetical protein
VRLLEVAGAVPVSPTLLASAVRAKDLKLIRAALAKGVDPCAVDGSGVVPLHVAVDCGYPSGSGGGSGDD